MPDDQVQIHFDFVDPLSYLACLEWTPVLEDAARPVAWQPFELRPPPTPLVAVDDPSLAARWELAAEQAERYDLRFRPPDLVPWTRKSHELMAHAAASGADTDALRTRLFELYLLEGRDIGRVDVLVELARSATLDPTETKAVLDVDRYEADIAQARSAAVRAGIRDLPTLTSREGTLEGFHKGTAVRTFLGT